MSWPLSSYFGWGVYGLNLMLNWSRRHRELLLTSAAIDETVIDLNPIERSRLRSALHASRDLQARLAPYRGQQISINYPVLHGLGNDFSAGAPDVAVIGTPNFGLTFFENTDFSTAGRERAKSYRVIVAGSSWNRAVLEEAGIGPVAQALQGVDATAFHPAPRGDWFAGRFAIFSGGKLEYRKGQDLVITAFRHFATRHADALLVTAWASPWPAVARSFNGMPDLAPVPLKPDGRLDISGWAVANGIAPEQFIDLGALPNSALPRLYREMDVALFPNRCEGGTNLVAMECMACAVPVILSRNTGHVDLIAPDRCFVLDRQMPIPGAGRRGWGESDIEEIVETLEALYRNREDAASRARRGAEFMRTLTWSATVDNLTCAIEPYL